MGTVRLYFAFTLLIKHWQTLIKHQHFDCGTVESSEYRIIKIAKNVNSPPDLFIHNAVEVPSQ